MSVRVHVAASYGADSQEFGEVLKGVETHRSGPWYWLQASVWGVSGDDLDEGLLRLSTPSFRMTTVDGALWYLHLFHGGERRFTLSHFFSFLRPVDSEDRPRRSFLTFLKDYEDYGIGTTKEMRRELKGLSFEEARQRFVELQAESLCDAFAEAGLPCPREELMAVLTGASVTEEELDWDVGDLPRFLDVLGLGDVVPGWREDAEGSGREAAEPDEPVEEPDYVAELIDAWEGGEPVPLEGGAVELPLADLYRLCRVAWFCDEDVDAALRITWPEGAKPQPDFSSAQYAHLWDAGRELHVGCAPSGGKLAVLLWTREAGAFLKDLPDDSVLELFTASEYAVGRQRYRGPIRGGIWQIEEATPRVSRETLEQALALSRYVDTGGALKAQSPEDAEAIAARAKELYNLGESGLKKPTLNGASIFVRGKDVNFERSFLALCAFRRWFRETWNAEEVDAALDENRREWDEMIKAIGAKFEDALASRIPQGEMVYEGRAATFNAIRRGPEELPDAVNRADLDFAELGMDCLGEMTCSAVPGIELRGYATDDGSMYGVLMRSPFGEYKDLVSYFGDGASLTTTTTPNAANETALQAYKKHFGGSDMGKMRALHLKECARLQETHGPIRPVNATLEGLAQAMDEYLARSGFSRK